MKLTREQIMNATENQLNEWTAFEVMGWKMGESDPESFDHYINENGKRVGYFDWNPAIDLNDSFIVADKFEYLYLFRRDGQFTWKWECKLVADDPEGRLYYGTGDEAAIAICRAALLTRISS